MHVPQSRQIVSKIFLWKRNVNERKCDRKWHMRFFFISLYWLVDGSPLGDKSMVGIDRMTWNFQIRKTHIYLFSVLAKLDEFRFSLVWAKTYYLKNVIKLQCMSGSLISDCMCGFTLAKINLLMKLYCRITKHCSHKNFTIPSDRIFS